MSQNIKSLLSLLMLTLLMIAAGGCGKKEQSLSVEPVYLVQLSPSAMMTQLASGEIDGFLLWEPYPAEAELQGIGKMWKKSEEIWENHPCCVLAVANNNLEAKIMEVLIWAHVKGTRYINDEANKNKTVEYAMAFTGTDEETVREALANIKFVEYPNESEFKAYYSHLQQRGLLVKSYTDIGYSTENEFFADYFTKSLFDKVIAEMDKNTNWKPEPLSQDITVRFGRIVPGLPQLAGYIAEQEGYYTEVGLVPGKNLVINNYPNGVAVMEAFRAKELDAAYLGSAPATLKRVNDDISINVIAGAVENGSGLVVGLDVDTSNITTLAGRTIAIPGIGTVQHAILEKLLEQAGLRSVLK
jgi:NitT/TauT family transport system substrate-binding protein